MPSIRPTNMLTSISRTRQQIIQPKNAFRHPGFGAPARYYAQGYGDGKGDPRGDNPQEQGKSNKTKENAEHPGPSAPAAGESSSKTPADASAESGGARSKEAKETGSSPTGGSVGQNAGKNGASPTLQSNRVPGDSNSADKQAEVEKHNSEFEKGHDRAPNASQG